MAYGNRLDGEVYQHETLMRDLLRQKPRALICSSNNLQHEVVQKELMNYLANGGIAVCYDWPLDLPVDRVLFDREHNTYTTARHLLENGHREIGIYVPWGDLAGLPRLQGFCNALAEFGIAPRAEWIFRGDFHMETEIEGAILARQFLGLKQRPTAITVINDTVAASFAAHLARAGLQIPQDLSLIGHDNRAICEHGPLALSSMTHPVEEIAEALVALLQNRLIGDYSGPARKTIVRGQLVPRESVRNLD